ncbi:DUF1801 domain-containing protein [Saccharicrinis sp. FJH2]|uniref:DUF1801 domain-containing protein n=1 Tax=Saccharicrinis sp. FJH65 TaxID=3344659 RepID=UPI0035F34918
MAASDDFYFCKEEPNKSCLLALRSIILEQDSRITETVKYGMPCFCFKNKACCYLWEDRNDNLPYILMVEGKYLNFPGLEAENRSRMKILKVNPMEDIPIDEIETLLLAALDLYRNGIIHVK